MVVTDEPVAVKVIKPLSADDDEGQQEMASIVKEIKILRECDHPNIVGYKGSYKDEEYLYVPS